MIIKTFSPLDIQAYAIKDNYLKFRGNPMLFKGYINFLTSLPYLVKNESDKVRIAETLSDLAINSEAVSEENLISLGHEISQNPWWDTKFYRNTLDMLAEKEQFRIFLDYEDCPETVRLDSFMSDFLKEMGLAIDDMEFMTNSNYRMIKSLVNPQESEMSRCAYSLSKEWINLNKRIEEPSIS